MTAMSNYLENALLDHVLKNTAYTSPTTVYGKLHIGDPGEDCTLNPSTETTRVALTFSPAASRVITTSAQADWLSIGVSAQETITFISIWDNLTAGNPLAYGSAGSTVVDPGDDFFFAAGDIDISADTSIFTTFLANALLDHVFRNTAYTQPAGLFVKPHIGAPGFDATGNPAAETTRANAGTFSAAVAGSSDNDAAISWTAVAASETWTDVSIWDASTLGNALLIPDVNPDKAVNAGNNVEYAAGALILNFA